MRHYRRWECTELNVPTYFLPNATNRNELQEGGGGVCVCVFCWGGGGLVMVFKYVLPYFFLINLQ